MTTSQRAVERIVRENRTIREKLRRAERAIREGRTWDEYQADDGVTVNDEARP